jgi:hypothetical protein
MKRWILLAATLYVFIVPMAHAGQLYVQVDAHVAFENHVSYSAGAHYDYDIFDFRTANVWGVALLNGSGQASQYFGPTMANHPDIASGEWDYDGTDASCYEAHATAFEDLGGTTQGAGSPLRCTYWKPDSYDILISTNVDGTLTTLRNDRYQVGTTVQYSPVTPAGYRFIGWSGYMNSSAENISFQMPARDITLCANFVYDPPPPPDRDPNNIVDNSGCPAYQNCNSPIIINLSNGPYQLSGRNQPVSFDIDANGTLDRIGWTAAGAPMAFLALDRNGNGTIDSGAELFGNHTPLRSGVAANGFDALAQYDANGDGIIDGSDPIWPSLLLWTDLNHDGISQPSELALMSTSTVTAIGLDYHWTGRRDQSGNIFRYQSRVWIDSGGKHATPRPVYDVYFIPAP